MNNILFIESDQQRCDLIRAAFASEDKKVNLQFVPSRSHAIDAAGRDLPGIVFLKSEPEPDELRGFLQKLITAAPRILPVLITDHRDEASVLQAFRAGITECIGTDIASIARFPAVADQIAARYGAFLATSGIGPVSDESREVLPLPARAQPGDEGVEISRLKELLSQSSNLALVGSLVSGIVHEINNPLTGTLAYTELLAMKVTDEAVREDLDKILQSAERCKTIIDNLLTFSRQRATSKSIGSINSIIEQTVDLRSYSLRAGNIEIVKDFGVSCAVFAEAQQIQHALLYILLNAEEAVSGSERKPGRITFTTRDNRSDRTVVLQIADTGPGIDPEIMSKIFDPFFTTKSGKCGLGLSLSKDIITRHGGAIRAENVEGGAIVTIVLPTGANV